jgi:hypothetical protein
VPTCAHTCIYRTPLYVILHRYYKITHLLTWMSYSELATAIECLLEPPCEQNKICSLCYNCTKGALNKHIYLQWTLGDRNCFLPSILVPVSGKRGKRCNIILVDVVTVHVSLAKTATAPNNPIQKQPEVFQVTYFLHRMFCYKSLGMEVTKCKFHTVVWWQKVTISNSSSNSGATGWELPA